jgi:hypothetical protein
MDVSFYILGRTKLTSSKSAKSQGLPPDGLLHPTARTSLCQSQFRNKPKPEEDLELVLLNARGPSLRTHDHQRYTLLRASWTLMNLLLSPHSPLDHFLASTLVLRRPSHPLIEVDYLKKRDQKEDPGLSMNVPSSWGGWSREWKPSSPYWIDSRSMAVS